MPSLMNCRAFSPDLPITISAASTSRSSGKKTDRLLTCLFLLMIASLCSCSSTRGPKLNTAEQMMWSTYVIGSEKGLGAGFVIFRHDSREAGGVVPVMVTAAHLLKTVGKGPLFIGARVPDSKGGVQVAIIKFVHDKKTPFYVQHPEQDVAAFDLRLPKESAGVVALPSFISRIEAKPPRAGEEVSFVGFPEMVSQLEGLFPIMRSGHVASYPVSPQGVASLFVIDADVFPGDSGGPVFIKGSGGRPVLAGMVIERVSPARKDFSHLAVSVSPQAIRETLELLEAR